MKKTFLSFLLLTSIYSFSQQSDNESYIKKESVGGKLDFSKKIEAQYKDAPFIRFGDTLYNKKDFTILLWAANIRNLGIESIDKAVGLWEEIYKRELTEPEKRALKTGFEAKF